MESGMLTPCFTLPYAAPEVLDTAMRKSQEGYNESCDLWSLGVILFAMLSGRAPFYSRAKTDSASSIMRRIKEGDFRLEGDAWRYVSSAARNLTKGLLTVDPRKRFSMDQLCNSPWIAAASSQTPASQPCLLTASLLIAEPTERCLKQTYDAFHNATREGFRLTPVASASSKLLQKRKMKQSVSSDASSSSLSDRSSFGSKSSGSVTMTSTSTKHWSDAVHQTPSSSSGTSRPKDLEIFSFKSGHVQQYLSSYPTANNLRTGTFTHPLICGTPLNVPLTVQVPNAAPTFSSSHHSPFIQSSFITSPILSYPPRYPYSDNGISGVSLSLIQQQDLDVINSSSVIQKSSSTVTATVTSSSYQPSQCLSPRTCSDGCTCGCSGPITRSRKRRLCDGDTNNSDKTLDHKVGKMKMQRTGTIVIE